MNWDEVRGNAALAFGAILLVWVFMLRTNFRRIYRILPALCAGGALFALCSINDRLTKPEDAGRFSHWWYQNIGFVAIAAAICAIAVAAYQQGQHMKRCGGRGGGGRLKRSHAHVRTQR